MSNWIVKTSEKLKPLYLALIEILKSKDIIHADETRLQVINEKGREASSKSWMWLYRSSKHDDKIIIYEYRTTRASKVPTKFLDGFVGYLHTDGYQGYNSVKNVTQVGCFAHARRKFTDTLNLIPDKKSKIYTEAHIGFDYINKLYKIEKELKEVSIEERYEKRLELSKPLLEEFLAWLKLKKKVILPKSKFGTAIKYSLNQWDKLIAFLKDGRLEIDNNIAERSIKPFVIGRKNWLFSNTQKGAISSAIIYSIVETAKANELSVEKYLNYILNEIKESELEQDSDELINKLLPWNNSIPEDIKVNPNK